MSGWAALTQSFAGAGLSVGLSVMAALAQDEKSAAISPSWVTRRTACGRQDNSSTASAISRATPTEARPGILLWTARTTGLVPCFAAVRRRSLSFSSINSVVGNAKT